MTGLPPFCARLRHIGSPMTPSPMNPIVAMAFGPAVPAPTMAYSLVLRKPGSASMEPQPHHNRYDYSPIIERPDYSWPDGKRLAVYLGLNVEHFAFGEGLGHTLTALAPAPDQRNYAWRDYG